jgi:hypothetical protein
MTGVCAADVGGWSWPELLIRAGWGYNMQVSRLGACPTRLFGCMYEAHVCFMLGVASIDLVFFEKGQSISGTRMN